MRLLAATDFALRLLMRLGAAQGGPRTTEALAAEIGVPRNHVHKIVQHLAEAGFVATLRGAKGGVRLARPAAEIMVGAVVRRFEAPQAIVECFREDGGACPLSGACRLEGALARARETFLASLDAVSVADCIAPVPVRAPAQAPPRSRRISA
jgi:Rrf2 family nitric oxide-sensitive transcriptional repressor